MSRNEKVWFITGCSTGFGRELANKVIDSGYKVVVTARNKESIKDLMESNEANVLALELDVTDKNQINAAVQESTQHFGQIDVLVNNAGIGYFGTVEESVEAETRKMFEINFWGLMQMTNAVLPYMRERKSGHIINFSSMGGLVSFPALGYYHATKYAVEGISESLAQEVAPFNIHVTLVEPSQFRTDWAGRSSVKTETTIYKETAGTTLESLNNPNNRGKEPGDPKKAADSIISIVELENPPLRLLLGEVAYQVVNNKYTKLLQSVEEWKEITLNADYE